MLITNSFPVAGKILRTTCGLSLIHICRFDDRLTGNPKTFAKNAKVAHIDIDPAEIGKIIAVDIPVAVSYTHLDVYTRQVAGHVATEDIKFGYCTEIMIALKQGPTYVKDFDYDEFRNYLNNLGDSLLVVNDEMCIRDRS